MESKKNKIPEGASELMLMVIFNAVADIKAKLDMSLELQARILNKLDDSNPDTLSDELKNEIKVLSKNYVVNAWNAMDKIKSGGMFPMDPSILL